MNIEIDSRVAAQAFIHRGDGEAKHIIRNLLEDLSAAYGEIRALRRERDEARARIVEAYGNLEKP